MKKDDVKQHNVLIRKSIGNKQTSIYRDAYPKEGFSTYFTNLRTYLAKNQLLKKLKISGNVHVKFVVDTNGKCKDIALINEFEDYPKVNETIMNAIIIAGEWYPATDSNGKKYTVRKTIPININ